MEKQFIPYEQALALKELGFDEACFGLYAPPCKTVFLHHYGLLDAKEQHLAPLYQQAFRWFREKHQIDSHIKKDENDDACYGYEAIIECEDDFVDVGTFNTYEEAELACLNKLIEIVKTK
jgi:hypothetical protein